MSDHKHELAAGVFRTDLPMADGRTIRYYDQGHTTREAVDTREKEERPGLGELRLDPLTNEWTAIAAHRQARVFLPPKELCPLCATKPGLISEIPDKAYQVVVFDNKSPSFADPGESFSLPKWNGLKTKNGQSAGKCEVICFTDNHETSFHQLDEDQIRIVMEAWRDRTRELSKEKHIAHIAPFENRGEEVGVTLSHPHGQIYAYPFLPPRTEKMYRAAKKFTKETGKILLEEIIKREVRDDLRIVAQNEHWIAYVPFAARYPFEIHVAPKKSVADLAALSDAQADSYPAIAKEVLQRLDGVFGIEMAYIAAWHQAPVRKGRDVMRLHWQITSVRRAPGKLKYLAGSESAFGAFIMDLKPEQSAQQLRDVRLPKKR
jgi:UDPglucose--hexose-1-phosphate uridylyltransferase